MSLKVFDNPILEKALDGAWMRNNALMENIANVDTPGYKRKDVNFEDCLKKAINNKDSASNDASNTKHIPVNSSSLDDVKFKVTKDYSTNSMRLDGNNVDVDVEMANLAKNSILYNTYSTLMNGYYTKLRTAIKEGR